MTVKELIHLLTQYPDDEPVIATWEGITREISIYRAKDGAVIVDADDEHYRTRFESGEFTPKKWWQRGDDR